MFYKGIDMIIRDIEEKDYAQFEELFCNYYAELDCEDDPCHLFDEYVLPDLKAELFSVAVCADGDKLTGFVIYQIDDPVNDWSFKDGSGDIREIYVDPLRRGKNAGTELLRYAESKLKLMKATEIYLLPTEDSEEFFIKRGYGFGGEYCEETGDKVYFKII